MKIQIGNEPYIDRATGKPVEGRLTVYLLNTEPHLAQEAIVERAEGSARVKVSLAPGEIKAFRQHQ